MLMEFKAPERIIFSDKPSIFLAGTIDMGNSENWQADVTNYLRSAAKELDIYNPRRTNWDSSWKQGFKEPQFFQQVTWEMNALDRADVIIVNLLPDSKSPISLLEIGLYAGKKTMLVCCPDEFYRSGNVQMVCDKYRIPLFKTMQELLKSKIITNL